MQTFPKDFTGEEQKIAILGSTGSIGRQTLDIVTEHPELFKVGVLTARSHWQLLAQQAIQYQPDSVVIADASFLSQLRDALRDTNIKVYAGDEAVAEAAKSDADIIVQALVGYSGLLPTLRAIEAGKTIALANKETLVVAGDLVNRKLRDSEATIIPVDSEHSAIFQCLQGEDMKTLSKLILTASGGPFRTLAPELLQHVTASQALKHPNWDMGAKVTIDSASMMNKGFEMIEAKWLFNVKPDDIEIVVHPQSIIHSMVEFQDGAVKAQLGTPDMHTPIRYALGYPHRLTSTAKRMQLKDYANLTFEAPDFEKFPLLKMAFDAIAAGGTMPCVMNAANEVAVEAFLHNRIRFTDMAALVADTMDNFTPVQSPMLDDYIATNESAVKYARQQLNKYSL